MYRRTKHFIVYSAAVVLAVVLALWVAIVVWAASNGTFPS